MGELSPLKWRNLVTLLTVIEIVFLRNALNLVSGYLKVKSYFLRQGLL